MQEASISHAACCRASFRRSSGAALRPIGGLQPSPLDRRPAGLSAGAQRAHHLGLVGEVIAELATHPDSRGCGCSWCLSSNQNSGIQTPKYQKPQPPKTGLKTGTAV
jgi:hypothetical protein